jgi:hypothetical protein
MRLIRTAEPFDSDEWLFEPKIDVNPRMARH